MRPVEPIEFPARQGAVFRRARWLAWLSLIHFSIGAVLIYLVMGTSQAMRTSLFDNLISLLPPIVFLVGARIAIWRPSKNFPYGVHKAVSIGYLTSSLALLALGLFLLSEAATKLILAERTTIGGFDLFGTTVWAGWPMIAALAYTAIPAFLLGRAKLKLAPLIHDKALFADAEINRADWLAELAAAAGVIGTGFGLWWADAVAAGLISLDIARDGLMNVRTAVADLVDEMPKTTINRKRHDPLPKELERYLESFDWVEKVEVRMREEGHVFFGEAFVVPKTSRNLINNVADLAEKARAFNWRIHDLTIMPVTRKELEGEDGSVDDKKSKRA